MNGSGVKQDKCRICTLIYHRSESKTFTYRTRTYRNITLAHWAAKARGILDRRTDSDEEHLEGELYDLESEKKLKEGWFWPILTWIS